MGSGSFFIPSPLCLWEVVLQCSISTVLMGSGSFFFRLADLTNIIIDIFNILRVSHSSRLEPCCIFSRPCWDSFYFSAIIDQLCYLDLLQCTRCHIFRLFIRKQQSLKLICTCYCQGSEEIMRKIFVDRNVVDEVVACWMNLFIYLL